MEEADYTDEWSSEDGSFSSNISDVATTLPMDDDIVAIALPHSNLVTGLPPRFAAEVFAPIMKFLEVKRRDAEEQLSWAIQMQAWLNEEKREALEEWECPHSLGPRPPSVDISPPVRKFATPATPRA